MEGTAPEWSTTFHTVVLPQYHYNHVELHKHLKQGIGYTLQQA